MKAKPHARLMKNVQTKKGHIIVFANWDIRKKTMFA